VDSWNLRADPPGELTLPVPVDPDGRAGPTKGQARGPSWRRTSTGLYVPSAVDRGRVEQRILEEAGRLRGRGAVSGWAALRLHGGGYFDGCGPDGRATLPVPLVVTPGVPLRRAPGIEAHRERLPASEVTERHGIPCTTPERAAFDAARWSPDLRTAVVALDMSLAPAVVQLARAEEPPVCQGGMAGGAHGDPGPRPGRSTQPLTRGDPASDDLVPRRRPADASLQLAGRRRERDIHRQP
jgi:hypothetical protein